VPASGAATALHLGRRSRLAPALGVAVLVVAGAGATFLLARRLSRPAAPVSTTGPATGAATATSKPAPTKPTWPTPHALAGETLATDETFRDDGLRVQSVRKRDAAAVRDAYREVLGKLRAFCAASDVPAVRALAGSFHAPPLNLVVVPQALLDAPKLWPEYGLSADSTYPSRYVAGKRTLFVNDGAGFETRDLPYGVALHLFSPVAALSDDQLLLLAKKFEAYYSPPHSR
jgi:hypothetical protein